MLTHSERISSARKVIENLLRARRATKIYQDGDPVAAKSIDDLYSELLKLLSFQDKVSFEVTIDSIHFELEEVFHSASLANNIPLFLFRDGIREVSFKKGLTRAEVSDLVSVLSGDLEREGKSDDVVTKLWDHDFAHIRFIVFEPHMFAGEDARKIPGRDAPAEEMLSAELQRAHACVLLKEPEKESFPDVIDLREGDLIELRKEVLINRSDKTGKLLAIIFELFLLAETEAEYDEIENIMKKAVERALDEKKIDVLADFFIDVKKTYMDSYRDQRLKANLCRIFAFFSSEEFLIRVCDMLDGGLKFSDETFGKLILLLERKSIPILITILGYLDTNTARKTVVNILSRVGIADVHAVARGLSDERWYVVRNIVITLRKIGDRDAKKHLLKIAGHRDARVRKEVVKALARIGGVEIPGLLKEALNDPELSVRQTALKGLEHLIAPLAKAILFDIVQSSAFIDRAYEEKKDYYQALLRFGGGDVRSLLERRLQKRCFFRRTKNDEDKAAIVYNIGILGDKEFLGCLNELTDSKTAILRLTVAEAIRKIEHGL